ncbi:MAG: SH3 domain-containing protein [Planctomycetota bacterium]
MRQGLVETGRTRPACFNAWNLAVIALLTFAFAIPTGVQAQEKASARYARVKSASTPARAGRNDFDAEIHRLAEGDVVEVVATKGSWAEIRVSGGFAAYCRKSADGKTFVQIKRPGEGLVIVRDLQLRPAPQVNSKTLGQLSANQRLIVLAEEPGGWLKVLAPRQQTLFVPSALLTKGGDQLRLAQTFADRSLSRETQLLASGRQSRRALDERQENKRFETELQSLDAELEKTLRSSASASTFAALRGRYQTLARKAGPNSSLAQSAERQAAFVRERENFARSLGSAEQRINRLESELATGEKRYEKELTEIRTETRTRISSSGRSAKKPSGRFLEHGIGRIYKDYAESLSGKPVFMLTKAGERRYRLVSDRYDLAEYHSKEIAITKWEMIDDRNGSAWPKVFVERIEIIN